MPSRRTLPVLLLAAALQAQAPAVPPASVQRTFRQWCAGMDAGGAMQQTRTTPAGQVFEVHEWTRLERLGVPITQDLVQTALRRPDGSLEFTFSLTLSAEPLTGTASWSPSRPEKMLVTFKGLPPRTVDLPRNTVLWPQEEEDLLRAAARASRPVRIAGFLIPALQPTLLDLEPVGPEPLPGFPGTVHFRGKDQEGPMAQDVEVWISPEEGEVRTQGSLGGIALLQQRSELPPPEASAGGQGLFGRTVKALPPNPFTLWLPEVTVRWEGKGDLTPPEDAQQHRLGRNHYRLAEALPLSDQARREPPVTGKPSPEDVPFLAETPLLRFRDPVFDGLLKRLAPPAGASRYDLAQRVNRFVYDWIETKDYTVGFASAQEVARNPRGDCTEHAVLTMALLRRLGVPARGVVGWAAGLEEMELHFWVEARIGGRWYPIDPTYDMVPPPAFRIKLATTDLADLGSVGWDDAAGTFQEGTWVPEAPWGQDARVQGDTVFGPGFSLRVPGSRWSLDRGALALDGHRAVAAVRPSTAVRGRLLQGATGRKGWIKEDSLWVDCGEERWLNLRGVTEGLAFRILDVLEAAWTRPRPHSR
jgi:transglutaminase-like putative cysteine protease